MGILDSGISKIRKFNLNRKERAAAGLLRDTKELERNFIAEAKRLGISINNLNSKNYYEILGLKYTTDQKAIKEAYVTLVKRYHPDISKEREASRKTTEINEAYSILKDKRKKEEYDAKSLKGSNKIGEEADNLISNALLKRYSELKSEDFAEFNQRVAVPQYRDSIRAAIEETADWNSRFNRAADSAFERFKSYGMRIRHAESLSRNLMRSGISDSEKELLRENLLVLEGLSRTYQETEKSIKVIIERVRREISPIENSNADRLRRQIN